MHVGQPEAGPRKAHEEARPVLTSRAALLQDDVHGTPAPRDGTQVVASNGALHDDILTLLRTGT